MTVSFKTIGASLGIFASGVAIVAAVEAPAKAQNMCFTEQDSLGKLEFCVKNIAFERGGYDSFTIRGFYNGKSVRETMNVSCNNGYVSDWNSRGTLTQREAEMVASEFCSGRGTTGQ